LRREVAGNEEQERKGLGRQREEDAREAMHFIDDLLQKRVNSSSTGLLLGWWPKREIGTLQQPWVSLRSQYT
jgi:hypothetical protein